MSTTYLSKSATRITTVAPFHKQCNSAGATTGAAMINDTSALGDMVKLPAGAAISAGGTFAGLIVNEFAKGGGSVVGQDLNLQRVGIGKGLLSANTTVTVGQELVIGGIDGSLRPFVLATDDDCEIIGTAEQTLSSQTYVQAIKVNLDNKGVVHKDNT